MCFEQLNESNSDLTHSNSYEQFEHELFDNEAMFIDFEKKDDDLLDLLRNAVKIHDITLMHELLKKKPNLQTSKGGYILWDAIFEDNMEIASILIRSGANLNVKKPNDNFDSSLLYELGSSQDPKHQELALLIMEYGGKANEYEAEYMLCRAIDSGLLKNVEALLKRGTPVRYSTIHQMVRSPWVVELISVMIGGEYIDVETKYIRAVDTFYQLYVLPGDESRIMPAVETLLNMGLDMNVASTYGDILICAIRCRKNKTVKLLIEHGINVNKPSTDGTLPLYSAVLTNQPETVELLIHAGARIDDRSGNDSNPQTLHYGQYALHAAYRGPPKEQILHILLSHGADVNVVDRFCRTPFSYARFSKSLNDAHRVSIKHFAILESKGIGIHKSDRKIIQDNPEMKEFNDKCMRELELMRSINISRYATFFSVLAQNVQKLSFFMRSRQFRNKINEYRLEVLFPNYAKDMELKLKNAKQLKEIMIGKEDPVCEVLEYLLPYPAVENVILHLYLDSANDH